HEREQYAPDTLRPRHVDRPAEDRGMPAVHTVEHSDRHDAAPPVGGDCVEAMPALHERSAYGVGYGPGGPPAAAKTRTGRASSPRWASSATTLPSGANAP